MSPLAVIALAIWAFLTTAAVVYIVLRIERIERLLGITEEEDPATRDGDSVSTKTGAKMC